MRLFIAIDLPEDIKQYMRGLQGFLPSARMSMAGGFHLTLKFLGEVDEAALERIKRALDDVSFEPFKAELGPVGFFGSAKSPRVAWVGLKTPDWLKQKAIEIENRMAELGFEKEKEPHRFAAHITLARVKFVQDGPALIAALQNIKVEPRTFEVGGFHLFESRLSSAGAQYEILDSFPKQKRNQAK